MNETQLGDFGPEGQDYVLIPSASGAHAKGDLVYEAPYYGYALASVADGDPYVLVIEHHAACTKKKTGSEVLALGSIVEFVAAGEGETTATVQAHSAGVKIGDVVVASGATDDGAMVMLRPHYYLAHD